MVEFVSLQPEDLLIRQGRVWKVVGVYIGALKHESLVEIEPLDRVMSEPRLPIQVPIDLIDGRTVYRRVDHAALAQAV